MVATLPTLLVEDAVKSALQEDLGLKGDITSNGIFDESISGSAVIRSREIGILAGMSFVEAAFKLLTPDTEITWHKNDGDSIKAEDKIATISAPVRTLLTGERTALNFLGRLTGIATLTNHYVQRVNHTKAAIIDTRKTTPGLRFAEKYATTIGGAQNHRLRLDDAVLIKDNHIAFAGSIENAIDKVRTHIGHMVKVEVEVDRLDQLEACLSKKVDVVLLDNMSLEDLHSAVRKINGKLIAEASGGVTLETVTAIAETGVDLISVGALTHSAPCFDLGLDIDTPPA